MTLEKAAANVEKPSAKSKSAFRARCASIIFIVTTATLIRWSLFEAFTIPTPSMESSLMVGDFLLVSKLHYGSRTPVTPLQVPLTHQTIWGSDIPSYSEAIQLPSLRLPGFSEVKRGDVVVFNYPHDLPARPMDLRTNYIKRCVGIAGDTLEIKNSQVIVNGKPQQNPTRLEYEYFMTVHSALNVEETLRVNGVSGGGAGFVSTVETFNDTVTANDVVGYRIYTTAAIAKKLATYDFVKEFRMITTDINEVDNGIFPQSDLYSWNSDHYGPVIIPKKGATVNLTPKSIALYKDAILNFEGNKNFRISENKVFADDRLLEQYTFKQDYYFVMGDNRNNSLDSRYWGFVPKDHIVGKAVFVWMSLDPEPTSPWKKIRWDRVFKIIR